MAVVDKRAREEIVRIELGSTNFDISSISMWENRARGLKHVNKFTWVIDRINRRSSATCSLSAKGACSLTAPRYYGPEQPRIQT